MKKRLYLYHSNNLVGRCNYICTGIFSVNSFCVILGFFLGGGGGFTDILVSGREV